MPATTASRADAACVECAGKTTQIGDSGRSQRLDDRQDVGGEGIGMAHERSRAGRGRRARVSPISQFRLLSPAGSQCRAGAIVFLRLQIAMRQLALNVAYSWYHYGKRNTLSGGRPR